MDRAKNVFWILLDVLIFILIFGGLVGVNALKRLGDSTVSARTVTVSAEGKTTAAPDLATISFSVLSQGVDPTSVSNDNNKKMSAVTQFVAAKGVESKDMQTTAYDLQPNYQYDKNYQNRTIVGYTLAQTVTIKVRDFTKIPDILSGLAPLGVNQIGGVNFSFEDQDKFIAIARNDAITKVKQKAIIMAQAAGASLGEVITVSENPNFPIPYYPYAAKADVALGSGSPQAPQIQPGSEDVTDNVTITYSLQ